MTRKITILIAADVAALCFALMLIHLATGTTPHPLHVVLFAAAVATLIIASAKNPVTELHTASHAEGTERVKSVTPTFMSFDAEMLRSEAGTKPRSKPRS